MLPVQLPVGIPKRFSEVRATGETGAQRVRGWQKAPCGGQTSSPALGSHFHTALPDLRGVTPANLTSSTGENLTRMLHRCPGARVPAEGSASKTRGLASNSCSSFRRMLADKHLSTWAQKPGV